MYDYLLMRVCEYVYDRACVCTCMCTLHRLLYLLHPINTLLRRNCQSRVNSECLSGSFSISVSINVFVSYVCTRGVKYVVSLSRKEASLINKKFHALRFILFIIIAKFS